MKKRIKYEISEIGEVIGGATPSTKDEDNYGGDIPWITPKDLSSFKERYIYRGERNISEKGLNSCSAKLMPKNTVLFSSRAPIGYVAIAANELCTNQGFKSIIADETKINFLYLYYYLIYKKGEIEAVASGTTFKEVSGSVLKKFNIEIPESILEQKAIAATLSCLDDMIELNNRTNKVLEEMAQAIFKRWFVDFEFPNEEGEPYKSSGGEMVESELGEIPKGWRVGNLGDIANITSGKRPQEKKDTANDVYFVPLVGASTVMGFVKEILYNERILIIGRVGTHGIIQRFNSPCWPSDNTLVITSDYYEFTNQILKGVDYNKLNRGSTQPLITQTDMKNVSIILPSIQKLKEFESLISSIFQLYDYNRFFNANLSSIRDTLLPKLMSGEIRVPVEEVV